MTRAAVAIIGVGLRLPGADSLDALWAHLAAGRSLITEVPPRRWDARALRGSPAKENKTNSIWGGFLEDADAFDAAFFNISPREASWMDPQQRFALEMAWHAIENAGLRASALAGSRTGVYMGVCHWDYAELIEKHLARLDAYTPTGIAFSIIANRISHHFDFRGPSVANDTACAASMVSVYEAVRALDAGDCDLALAGGVNLCWSPNHFIAFAKSGMLSKDGKAKAFDARADGYVRGEGGAMLLLKPLARAEADGDPIHAVIRAIGANHGGRTNSLTVTNPAAQADLIAEVHRQAGASPDSISYIEAHGPGTPLGDPIEIAGLKAAFRTRAAETGAKIQAGSCGIGSVKTNIGHLEGAAGVAGIVKVLAALRHETLPPNVGFEALNPLIDLAGTPFRIQSEMTPWPRQAGQSRRAGVSSFGFGGTNAHVVIEEGAPSPVAERGSHGLLVMPLSAKSDQALRVYAEALCQFLDRQPHVAIADLALTFQVGREAMTSRVAFIVEDCAGLRAALQAFLDQVPDRRVRRAGTEPAEDEPWCTADQWVAGAPVDFLAPSGARRIAAPPYPFERQRHWIDTSLGTKDSEAVAHALLHRNISTFEHAAYRSRFIGTEFFFADHQVHGRQILPGVVALEMARAAYAHAANVNGALSLSDLVWARSIAAGDAPVDVEVRLTRPDDLGSAFTVAACVDATPGPACVQGRVRVRETTATVHDLAALAASAPDSIEPTHCYERLRASGVVHGPAFQALTAVRRGGGYVLAELRLPRRFAATLADLPLNPILIDAAIQAWVALRDDAPTAAGIPFACREVLVSAPCEAAMRAYVRPTPDARSAPGMLRLDIDLCDHDGRVCVAVKDLALRLLAANAAEVAASPAASDLTKKHAPVLARGVWSETPSRRATADRETTLFVAGEFARLTDDLASRAGLTVHALPPAATDAAATAALWFRTLHTHAAALMAARPRTSQKILVLVPDELPSHLAAPLVGLLRTAALEHPRMSGAVVRIAAPCDVTRLARIAAAEAAATDTFAEIRHDGDGRRRAWRPVALAPTTTAAPLQLDPDGAYWITGGLGGLGLIFAETLIARGARRIVLSGRSKPPTADRLARLDQWRADGIDIRYRRCDVARRADVESLVAAAESTLGPLKGIIHAAGLLDDAYIFGADPARADAVFAPKVAGTLNIDAATAHLDLSVFVLCSSVASAFGNAGQAAYAAANAFMDAFAEHRDAEVAAGRRRGVTRAMAWPLWAEGGMTVEATYLDALHQRFGTEPMPSAAGVEAFWQLLSEPAAPRSVVLYGDRARIDALLAGIGEPRPIAIENEAARPQDASALDVTLIDRTTAFLKELLSDATQINTDRIRADAPLVEYGLDSIIVVDVTTRLERVVGPLSKTLFFEHLTLASLAAHVVDEHADTLARTLPAPAAAMTAAAHVAPTTPSAALPARLIARPLDDTHDVAIIGLSLRVAKARDQDAFWSLLSKGMHAVGPVPRERWDHDAIYHPERDVLGKTVVKTGAFLDGIDKFDPRYFRISQAEAELMSPEVRLFLEASVEAFEDAGYSRETLLKKFGGDVAVLVGSMTNEYDYFGLESMLARGAPASGSYAGTVPNMVSYFYGLTGPSYFLDTMCSAASTCIHEAVHMLRSGRSQMALAGGVSLLLHPHKLIAVSQEHFTSKTAEVVRGYGLGADGTILGEGVGAVVLKRRADALRDGDHIYGVIKGTAVTNAGVRNGFTVPSPAQQAAAVSKAIEDAAIDPRTIGYVEGHGSGTALGDPIEIRALTQAFRAHTADMQFCPIGTVKSNVAHLLAAAGLAGVAKVLMQLKHGQLAPSLHAETLNPDIPFDKTPFYVQRELAPWRRVTDAEGRELPRRAGITSIGAGGMNAHLIIEEHMPPPPQAHPGGAEIAVISAMNAAALARHAARLRDHVAAHSELTLADVAYTLQVGRNALPCRLALVAACRDELLAKLDVFLARPEAGEGIWFTPSTLDCEPRANAERLKADTAARALERVAAAWAEGTAVDWDTLHAGRTPHRVSLPAYPFEQVRCWYPAQPDAPSVLRPLPSSTAPGDGAATLHRRPGERNDDARLTSPLPEGEVDARAAARASGAGLTGRSSISAAEIALRDALIALAAELLKFDQHHISPRASFYDLGFDSISLTRFAAAIGERFGIAISPAIFFECEHVDALARHLALKGAHPAIAPVVHAAPLRDDTRASESARTRIAIVGIAARLPGAENTDIFTERLLKGDDLTSAFPFHRYGTTYAERLARAGFAKRGGFLADVDRFDAAHFRISPVEAERMDPQQRLMLETVWRALESAGYRPQELPRDTGVFVGVSALDYGRLLEAHDVPHDGFAATGNSLAMIANRISHHLDVHGPSQAIDTACSSSLVALMRAADAIAAGQCGMAFVGGVNLALALEGFEGPHLAGMLSPGGRCKTFSAEADGYARGEGVVALLLKPLHRAEAEGDSIFGVLIGGAVNHGGRAGALTAPNAKAQAALVERAMAGIDPASIGYIETHGTGTALGDPVEIAALNLAYGRLFAAHRPQSSMISIGLGAVKSNIGHLEAAAGLAGVVKVLGAMQRGEIPATLHCQDINPHIELEEGPFTLVRERTPWPRRVDQSGEALPRRAGVSSFGFGGVNAHVVIEEYPDGANRRTRSPERHFAATRFWIPGVGERAAPDETVLLTPRWVEAELSAVAAMDPCRRLVLACGVAVSATASCRVVECDTRRGAIGARYMSAATAALDAIKAELHSADTTPLLVQLVHPMAGDGPLFAGLGALLDTATAECPRLLGQVVGVAGSLAPGTAAAVLDREAQHPQQRRVRHDAARRFVRTWTRLPTQAAQPPVWRDGGVYLITGGMGGLGRLLAADIAARAKAPVLILIGRSSLDAERAAILDSLRRNGAYASYHALDVAEPAAVAALVGDVIARHGTLDGVFHCAGALADRTLANKTKADLNAVLAPKVLGALALAEACRGLTLDSFVLFSSLAGAVGNAGQGDYAAANGFLDAFAAARSDDWPLLSIDWPLWRDGGMRIDATGQAALFERMGQRPLATQAGFAALAAAQASRVAQVAVVAGEGERIRAFFDAAGLNALPTPPAPAAEIAGASRRLIERTGEALRHLLARVSGVAAARIDANTPLDEYGIDSLMITRLNRALGDIFGPLSGTLLFEHRTLAALARYFATSHADGCRRLAGDTTIPRPSAQPPPQPAISVPADNALLSRHEPIAIIGMSGRYPGADDLDAFWDNLARGRDLIGEIPPERWSLAGFFEADVEIAVTRGQSYAKWGGFLDDFAGFDPLFFKISPRDAAAMDPQERLFLMSAWSACEDAGYTAARLATRHGAKVGVYVGVTKTGFALHGSFMSDGGAAVRPTTSFASIANRVSHVLDLAGPSLPVDTMCSSSLTAIHAASEALRSGTCEMALAGGVNLYLHPSNFIELSAARMLSPHGRCRSFGAGANGFVPGEGVGCIVLKPLSRALADGDRVHALIRATAVNHGGRTNGYTVPNPNAQCDAIRAALRAAGIEARAVTCIEAHGTGTDLGDPIEVTALTRAFAASTPDRGFCALGSVKSNIGHLEAAAGIAGLTKIVLQMQHGQVAPTLHATTPNPNLDLAATPFRLATELTPWTAERRIAGVSSFGAGGANAHVIVEEWRSPSPGTVRAAQTQAIVLSARDPERLRTSATRLLAIIDKALTDPATGPCNDIDDERASALRSKLAELLDVAADEIDAAESFETLGLDRLHRLALAEWLQSRFGIADATQFVRDTDTPERLAAILDARKSRSPSPHASPPSLRLDDIAYTLQVGREAMDARLALEASSLDDLAAGLRAFLDGRDHPGLHTGNVQEHRAVIAALSADSDVVGTLTRTWMARGSLGRLLTLWVQGLPVDWEELPREVPARIVSLPTYPFARDRYWLPVKRVETMQAAAVDACDRPQEAAVLLADAEALEYAIAPLVRAIVSSAPDTPLAHPYDRWREALERLLPAAATAASPELAWAAWNVFKADAPASLTPQITLADTMLRALPHILAGKVNAAAVMFPAGRLDLAEAVYKDNPVAARFSTELARTAGEWAGKRLAAAPATSLRVLEIGAGTGGTSEPVFAALAPFGAAIAEYRYTDVSRAFLIKAEQRFANRMPALATAIFDIEKPPAAQGIACAQYDLVIAANVLHATADIARTLGHVRALLAPGAALVMNETSCATLFTHVTFGLLDGWWRATDGERRIPGTPSLSPDAWKQALRQAGLTWRSGSVDDELRLGQQIIVAEAPGEAVSAVRAPAATGTLRETLRWLVAETLNMRAASVAVDKSFADYGLDSILGAELVERVRQALGIRIEQARLYDFASVARLEVYIANAYPEAAVAAQKAASATALPAASVPAPPLHASDCTTGRTTNTETHAREPIAVIGMSGRFAQSPDIDALWQHLADGRNLVQPVTRFASATGRHGGFIEGIDRFDPVFFGISGLEATYMDPQQRLFLEEAWKALEHAGHAGSAMEGRRCGVFVGCSAGDYQELFRTQPPGQAFWGNTASLIPARIAYCLDLKGPAIAVDTACSSSLVALDLAAQSLWSGESEMALAGGVFVQCTDRFFRYADAARMLSPSGRCAAFGADADGIVPGEAVAAVLLRPLSAALADGDTIYGLIVASGTNQDGATNGITAPSGVSQQSLMREVYRRFGIDAASIGFVEAHGTGTRLGDPIEYDALASIYAAAGVMHGSCMLGSVKSNLGHATTAAGITSLIKVLCALQADVIPPTLHIGTGNPAIRFADGPFRVNVEPAPWPKKSGPRRAAISSFGFSGTNAHVVVEEAPRNAPAPDTAPAHLVVLSARTPDQLHRNVERLVAHLARAPRPVLRDIAFTLLAGRRHLPHRLALVARDVDDLIARLEGWLARAGESGVRSAAVDSTAHDAMATIDSKDLPRLADAFLAGAAPDAETLYAGTGRRRLPLPVYPFAAGRHWVEDAPVVAHPSASTHVATMAPTPVPAVSRPQLQPLTAVAAVRAAIPTAKIKLAPLHEKPGEQASTMPRIAPDIDASGVCRFAPEGVWSSTLEAALADELHKASALAEVRAVLLRVPDAWGAPGASENVERLMRAVEDCAVPIVASVTASCSVGLRAVRACDFILPASEATGLARNIARAPRLALVELKRHMRREPLHPTNVKPAAEPLRAIAGSGSAGPAGLPRRIGLVSKAVALDAFDDGVVVLRMEERDGRNTFTPALMDGLSEAFAWTAGSPDIKTVVLTGFESYFACGGTADGLESLQRGDTQFTDRRIYSLPLECPFPVIAAMHGHAIGAGWALGLFADMTLFGAESVYHSNYLELGFTPGAGATLVFPSKLGDHLGREVLFSAVPFKGRELKSRAPALDVMPAAEVLPAALRLAHALAQRPRDELIAAKSRTAAALLEALPRTLAAELDMHSRTFVGNEEALMRIRAAFPAEPTVACPASIQPAEPQGDRRAEVRAAVVASLAEELMIVAEDIRDGSSFLDLGLDSILAVTWIRRLNARLSVELPATAVYANPTVGALVDRLAAAAPPAAPAVIATPAEQTTPPPERTAIAVIGMSGRFPKAPDLSAFWDNIRSGRDCIEEVPGSRWDIAAHYDPDPQAPGKSYCKWMGAIDGVDRFDPGFFNITPREAELMDPQQRLFLAHAWHAIEDAGTDPTSLAGVACGVFVGSGPSGYAELIRERNAYSLLGAAGSILAARIAYLLDLTGPAVSLDTACSSSLVAIAEACNSLVLGDSDLALAGGACVLVGPAMFVDTSKVSMLSKDGRCFTFDARANGFVPGEGVGVMLLKRLDDARRDGDPIRAVIRGWGVNQDGRTNGIAAPNPLAQSKLTRSIHHRYAIDPASIGLIECHGTGTALGDPIEIEGLVGAFAARSLGEASCAIGSVKSNVGHLLASAGVAGAMKAVLALEHAELPPTIHVARQNPLLALAGSPFYVNTEARPWPAPATGPRRAGVSAFGFSGTNAHIVLEAAPSHAPTATTRGPWVLPLSARSEDRLRVYAADLLRFVADRPALDLAALAATFQHGRTALAVRRAIIFSGRTALLSALEALSVDPDAALPEGREPLASLARRWCAGEAVTWPETCACRLQAPGYPFADEHCWIAPSQPAPPPLRPHRLDLTAKRESAMPGKAKVAIIGGGPTGIGVGRELAEAGIDFDLFEAEADFGGVWNGAADCGRAYGSLHLISPKFNTQVQDFPMPDHYPAYPNHMQMLAYIRGYAQAFGLYERTRFNAPIKQLTREGGAWRLACGDGSSGLYELVVIATGLQRLPLFPDPAYPGTFAGETLHTRHYKSADQIRRRRVLVVGGGNSGCDVAAEAVHHATKVFHSTRRGYHYQPKFIAGKPTPQWMMELGGKFATKAETLAYIEEVFRLAGYDGADYGLPRPDYPLDGAHPVMNSQVLYHIGHGDITPKGDVESFAGHTVRFRDGTSEEVDVVVYATGYRRDFPFLDKALLEWKAGIPDLFLHAVPRNHDNLLFMGFINAAGGLGDGLKTQGLFVRDYARAYFGRTRGLDAFLRAKRTDTPDLGQDQFVQSYRHLWEADLWKLLAHMRRYRDLLAGRSAASLDAAQ